jgi:hypothetical protein
MYLLLFFLLGIYITNQYIWKVYYVVFCLRFRVLCK